VARFAPRVVLGLSAGRIARLRWRIALGSAMIVEERHWLGEDATTVAILLVSKINPLWLLGTAGLLGLAGIG
jgi:hypothetical protein